MVTSCESPSHGTVTVAVPDGPYPAGVKLSTAISTAVAFSVSHCTCTGAVESSAGTLSEVVAEIAATEMTERGQTRGDDRVTEAAMEDRKRQGYF